jgi:hypothetical protein
MGMGMGRAWAWAWVGHGHGHLFILVRGLACFSGLGGLAHDTGGAGGHLFPGRPVVLLSLGTGAPGFFLVVTRRGGMVRNFNESQI